MIHQVLWNVNNGSMLQAVLLYTSLFSSISIVNFNLWCIVLTYLWKFSIWLLLPLQRSKMSSTYLSQYIILSVYLLLCSMCSCSMAVSYTHLDVYKRQSLHCKNITFKPCCFSFSASVACLLVFAGVTQYAVLRIVLRCWTHAFQRLSLIHI